MHLPGDERDFREAAHSHSVEDLQREIIDFDSEVPWPSKLKQVADATARTGSAG
jgi:hypothetical protein